MLGLFPSRRPAKRLAPARPRLEMLEERAVPAVDILVNNNTGYNGSSANFTQHEGRTRNRKR